MIPPPDIPEIWREPIATYPHPFDPWRDAEGYIFDVATAERICTFIETHFKHSKGQFFGQPFKLETWERQRFGHLYAWKTSDGRRRFRSTFLYIPRKNGKTQIASVDLILLTKYDGELGADVYCVAAAKSQAQIVYDAAKASVLMDDSLKKGMQIWKSIKSIEYTDGKGRPAGMCKVMASDGDLILGTNPHAFVVDEVLAQKKFDIMENLESGVGTRRQPLGIYLSTAADDGSNPCTLKIEYAKKVRDGQVSDPTYFPVIYELENTDDWHDEKLWKKVNPNLGVTITLEFLRSEHAKACISKADEIKFKRRYLNMAVASSDQWLSMEDWKLCEGTFKREDMLGKECYLTLDLSSTSDICAMMLRFPEFKSAIGFFYCPKDTYKSKIEYAAMFKDNLRLMPGAMIDYQLLRKDINELKGLYKIMKIGFDPWHAKELANDLAGDGFEMVQIDQSAKMLTDPIQQLEIEIRKHQLTHFNCPVLKWMAGNCYIWTDTNKKAVKVIKKNKDSPAKIDGMIALIMGKAMEIADNIDNKESVYEKRGVRTI